MTTPLARFRQQWPQYDDLPDAELARALWAKYRSEGGAEVADVTLEAFAAQLGVNLASGSQAGEEAPPPSQPAPSTPPEEARSPAPEGSVSTAAPEPANDAQEAPAGYSNASVGRPLPGPARARPVKPLSEIQITERVQDEFGSTYEVSRPAEQVLAEHDQRLSALSALLDCLAA